MSDEASIVVFMAHDMMEAELVKGILEAQGIMAFIPAENSMDPATAADQALNEIEVRAPRSDAPRAREILRRAQEDGEHMKGWVRHDDAGADGGDAD